MWSKKKCHVIVNCFRYRLPCNGANCNLRQVFHPYGVYPDDEKHRGATSREESQACLSCPEARMLQGVSQGAYLGIGPHTHLIFLHGKDTDNFSNNRSDAGINLSLEVKIILDGSGKCFLDSVSI